MPLSQKFIYCFIGCHIFTVSPLAFAEDFDPTNLSIEQLMESKVSTVTRTEQPFLDTAAAIYVITQDDIQRSGVTSIPDVLRMAPGVQIARISASEWAVTARGFNGRFANKLLVLLDGRTVYSPTFAGVRWENLDLVLNDIERIEVIRGPGASVWGHNAVNGVINIITKHTEDTQQELLTVTSGNEERAIVELRYGNQLDNHTHYRVFGKYSNHDESIDLYENNANDSWSLGRGGFRIDWEPHNGNRLMLTGDGYISDFKESFLLPEDNLFSTAARISSERNTGASLLARWEHDFSVASTTHTQFYYEYFSEDDLAFGNENRHTFDFDFQHELALWDDNHFNWGLGYRLVKTSSPDSQFISMSPTSVNLHLLSGFIQDKIAFFDDALHLTIGTKVQYYTLSGWNYQPTARLLWKIHPQHNVWAAFSRAIRSPSRGETALKLKALPVSASSPVTFKFEGNPAFDEEQVYSYELGYRGWLSDQISFDLAFFYNEYKSLSSGIASAIDPATAQFIISLENGAFAKTWGGEVAVDWRPIEPLRLQLSYSVLHASFYRQSDSSKQEGVLNDPENQFSFRSSYDVNTAVTFDAWVRYVQGTQVSASLFSPQRDIESYVGLDLRLAWKPISNLELSVTGQNLNSSSHLEYIEEAIAYPRKVERSVYGKIKWGF